MLGTSVLWAELSVPRVPNLDKLHCKCFLKQDSGRELMIQIRRYFLLKFCSQKGEKKAIDRLKKK